VAATLAVAGAVVYSQREDIGDNAVLDLVNERHAILS
jgi:hypothetical protein